jgi:hypothetical protein
LAGFGAFLALGGLSRKRDRGLIDRLARLPLAFTAATLGIILARPLGPAIQAYVTTDPNVGNMRIAGVSRERKAGIVVIHVRTEG